MTPLSEDARHLWRLVLISQLIVIFVFGAFAVRSEIRSRDFARRINETASCADRNESRANQRAFAELIAETFDPPPRLPETEAALDRVAELFPPVEC